MSKTIADHARAYRERKAAKLARYEAALRDIAEHPGSHACDAAHYRADVASDALSGK